MSFIMETELELVIALNYNRLFTGAGGSDFNGKVIAYKAAVSGDLQKLQFGSALMNNKRI